MSKELKLRMCLEEACSLHLPCAPGWLTFVSSSSINWGNCCGFFLPPLQRWSPALWGSASGQIHRDVTLLGRKIPSHRPGLPWVAGSIPMDQVSNIKPLSAPLYNARGVWRGTGAREGTWVGMKHRAGQERCWPCAKRLKCITPSLPGSCAVLN